MSRSAIDVLWQDVLEQLPERGFLATMCTQLSPVRAIMNHRNDNGGQTITLVLQYPLSKRSEIEILATTTNLRRITNALDSISVGSPPWLVQLEPEPIEIPL